MKTFRIRTAKGEHVCTLCLPDECYLFDAGDYVFINNNDNSINGIFFKDISKVTEESPESIKRLLRHMKKGL